MRKFFALIAFAALAVMAAPAAQAAVAVRVNLSSQTMTVAVDGVPRYTWAISSARKGYVTPNGRYRPQRLARYWYSRKYGGAMPHAVFFRGGYAIHGTTAVGALGRPASHGCIRLHPANAAKLYALVQGSGGTSITITGSRPGGSGTMTARSRHHRTTHYAASRRTEAPALGYAASGQRMAPTVRQWMNAPFDQRLD